MATNPILGGGGFHHVCVKTRNWDASMAFYKDVLGCVDKVAWRSAPTRAIMMDAGNGNHIEVFEDLAYPGNPDGAVNHFCLRTTRLDFVAERVRTAGYKITMEPRDMTIPNTTAIGPVPVRIFFCEGPNGESIEFLQNELT